ncbi:PREDICTED: protein-methionine sulfoxide oxidase MICAL1 isoform X3 [Gavialis gangeticus]|uniref:protein-methionine sulfoxide oxidase MICAL1 isoform X3 n=1 Tax=Gavialis gangeticus TaxID=94835 RepID=UPI00092FA45B|nr:PREDICTED: protein-methionine sulfoxide oxidase MICAL1 isoform X3 [Gavialis gangeticus]
MSAPDGEQCNPAHALFETFLRANECEEVLGSFRALCGHLGLEHTGQLCFYHKLKACLNYWSAKALWSKLDKKAGHKDYDQGRACANTKCLIIGAGPCGLRTAIELAFLGARVVVVEKRDSFSRNNVLHLWPFTIHDLRALGAKKFYGRFCTGSLDHISIRQLQLILLKVALLLGVEIHTSVQFKGLLPPAAKASGRAGGGWRATLQPNSSPVGQYTFDVLISAGGGKFVPEGFKRKETRGKLAIGITTNFVNHHSRAEVEVPEISGVARIYKQQFFQKLYNKTGIDLENIVYYKDDTHYFVMTAKKQSLLKMGVILEDKSDTESLLSSENVNREALLSYAKEAASFSTDYQLPKMEFALNHQNLPDVDMFDFTCMNRSENAALVYEHGGARLLVGLVGDCLVEPFWPLGTGVARGFLAAFDAAWMVKRWAAGTPPLEVLAERESIYQHLSQTSPDNTNKNTSQYSIDPTTRYPNINLNSIKPNQVRDQYLMGLVEHDHKKSDNRISTDSSRGYEELLHWCQVHTAGYRGVAVADFTHSWKSGLALCALIHHFRPDLLDFDSLAQNDPFGNNQMALDLAEQELGIPPVLSSTEMASMSEADQLGLIAYLSQVFDAFEVPPEPEERVRKPLAPRGTRGAILFLSKLQKSLSLTRKRAQDRSQQDAETKKPKKEATGSREQPQTPETEVPKSPTVQRQSSAASPAESSDACYFCGQRVYILERVSAEGRFFHRGCFQCWRCGATLRLGDFAFSEEDGHFYCLLHYNPHSLDVPPPMDPSRSIQHRAALDPGSPGLASEGARMETDSDLPGPPGSPGSLSNQVTADHPPEPWEGAGEDQVAISPYGENGTLISVDEQEAQEILEEIAGDAMPSGVGAGVLPAEPGPGLGDSRPHREEQGIHEHSHPGMPLQPATPEPLPLEKVPVPPESREDTEWEDNTGKKKKIFLSDLEKLRLATLNLTSDGEAEIQGEPQPPQPRPGHKAVPFRSVPDRGKVGLGQHRFSEEEEEEDLQETDSDEEEEEEVAAAASEDAVYLADAEILDVKEKYPTWRRTLTRRAKEAQMKRFCKAQAIQRRLEEIEVTFRELEEQGIKLEQSLRGEGGTQAELKTQWINQLLHLVQKKNSLVSEESDLMIAVQELKLEEKQCHLDQEMRRYMDMAQELKTPQDLQAEKEILEQFLEVVQSRDKLIRVQEEKRLSELGSADLGMERRPEA